MSFTKPQEKFINEYVKAIQDVKRWSHLFEQLKAYL